MKTLHDARVAFRGRQGAVAAGWLVLCLIGLGSSAVAGTTVTTTNSFDYDTASGQLKKAIVEPGDPNLCLVTEYTLDDDGQPKEAKTRNCNGLPATAAGASNETAAPTGDAVFTARSTGYTYSSNRRFVTETKNDLGHVETKTYDGRFGAVATLKGPNDLTTSWTYDGLGRKTLEILADGTRTRWEYVFCKLEQYPSWVWPTAPVGAATANCESVSANYNELGTDRILPLYYVQATPLQSDGVTPNGPYTRTYHDTLGRVVRTETQGFDAQPVYVDVQYDRRGNAVVTSRPYASGTAAKWVGFTYDVLNRVTKRSELHAAAGATTTKTAYSGFTTTVTDPRGHTTTQVRNVAGQVARITDAKDGNLVRDYDPLGNVIRSTDPKGNVISMVFDRRSRMTEMHDPDMGSWRYGHNAIGDLVRQTDAKQQTTTLAYDVLGRLIRRTEPDLTSSWHYDRYADGQVCSWGKGKLCEATTDNGYSRKHLYDSVGRPSGDTAIVNSSTYTVSLEYDNSTGRIHKQTYPTGVAVINRYTALGYLKSVVDARDDKALWTADSVDAQGHVLQHTSGNDIVTTDTYFGDGRLNTRQVGAGAAVQNLSHAYDLNGNVSVRIDVGTDVTSTYQYDELNRLTRESRSGGGIGAGAQVIEWTYDAIGNMSTRIESGTTNTYNYNTSGLGSHRPHAVANVSGFVNGYAIPKYTYDANGNLTSGAGRTVTWSSSNMVRSITANGKKLTYHYNPERDRVKETLEVNGTVQRTTVYINPGAGAGLFYEEEIGVATTKRRHYINAGGSTRAVIVCNTSPCVNKANNAMQYWHGDHLGSVSAVTDASRAVIERMAFEPFGKRRASNGATDPYGTLAPSTTRRGFTEHEHIDDIGLVNMNGRVYDPGLGRFMSADPTVPYPDATQSYNRYSYGRNNPLRMLDPSGFDDFDFGGEETCLSCGSTDDSYYQFWNWDSFSVLKGDLSTFGTGAPGDPMLWGRVTMQTVEVTASREYWEQNRPWTTADVNRIYDQGVKDGKIIGIGDVLMDNPVAAVFREFGASRGEADAMALAVGFLNPLSWGKSGLKLGMHVIDACCCFAAGTPVLTEGGQKRIEDIAVGDLVYARDPATGETALKPVVQLMHTEGKVLYRLTLRSAKGEVSQTEVTDNHPYWVKGRGWIDSSKLRSGMRLDSYDKTLMTVVRLERLKRVERTYNFTVADYHTYFAGVGNAFVHNSCACVTAAKEGAFFLNGASRAVIDPRKLTEYALNPSHPVGGNKARVFESVLGFTKENAGDLMSQLRQGVLNNPAVAGKVDQFGARFTVDILVTGPAGSGVVRSGWIYKAGSDTPELTTLFVK